MSASKWHHRYMFAGMLNAVISAYGAETGQKFVMVVAGLFSIGAFILAGSLNERRYDENEP